MKKMFSLIIVLVSIMCCDKAFAYKEYKIGDKVTYRGEEYYVIEDSDSNTEYISLLKDQPLTKDEVNKYNGGEYTSKNGEMPHDSNCDSIGNRTGTCSYSTNSQIKILLNNWINDFEDDLINIEGYKVRLIEEFDLKKLGFEYDELFNNVEKVKASENTPTWVYEYSYWTMTPYDDDMYEYYIVTQNGILSSRWLEDKYLVRPVINLKKSALGDSESNSICKDDYIYETKKRVKYSSYRIGEKVKYNGEIYYVLKESNSDINYVTLLKAKSLTVEELYKYGRNENGKLFINEYVVDEDNPEKKVFEYDDGTGGIAFYTSKTCSFKKYSVESGYSIDTDTSGCNVDFDKSDIKKVIDNWSKELENDLVSVDGYKVRLITFDELIDKFGYEYEDRGYNSGWKSTVHTPSWIYDYSFWTMSGSDNNNIYVVGGTLSLSGVFQNYSVKPVINLNKCAIDGGCWKEIIGGECVKDNNSIVGNDNKTIVNVENTLKVISKILFIISIFLIITGTGLLGYNYIKSKKERK